MFGSKRAVFEIPMMASKKTSIATKPLITQHSAKSAATSQSYNNRRQDCIQQQQHVGDDSFAYHCSKCVPRSIPQKKKSRCNTQ
mmetsp:Transcript_16209/g.23984  ORF Transcript_16209/g.23984 Transcript_16209/m.23984 type:complete len:84 (-) Transcript_16209:569-820(-)